MNPLERFPRVNNVWVDLKHRVGHRLRRRDREVEFEATATNPQNVLVVVVDCLRADHVSGFGHDRATTPTLDGLDAVAFSNAKAASTWTFPSVSSLLSGRYPHQHGARFDSDPRNLSAEQFPQRMRRDVATVPDLLGAAGYDTGMLTAIPMAEKAVGDRFEDVSVRYTPATERVAAAREWIADRDRWFCYLHLGDPHVPLDIPDEHRTTFEVPEMDGIDDWRFRETTDGEGFDAYRDAKLRAYDAAVMGTDDALRELLTTLDDDTVVAICGDHGEAFWDHPQLERRLNDDPRGYYATDHGHSVLEEVARVPLWIRAPGVERTASDRPVSLVDVAPTVLSALGIDLPESVAGRSLTEPSTDRALVCEETAYGYNQRAVWLNDRKAITVPQTGDALAFELDEYLEAEPIEPVPQELDDALSAFGEGVEGADQMDVAGDTRDRLEELGYLE